MAKKKTRKKPPEPVLEQVAPMKVSEMRDLVLKEGRAGAIRQYMRMRGINLKIVIKQLSHSMAIFPEGTRLYEMTMPKYKETAFTFAAPAGDISTQVQFLVSQKTLTCARIPEYNPEAKPSITLVPREKQFFDWLGDVIRAELTLLMAM